MANWGLNLLKTLWVAMSLIVLQSNTSCDRETIKHYDFKFQEAEIGYYPWFSYPIILPEKVFKFLKKDTVPIFGYGSLLNRDSASLSLSKKALDTYRPCLAVGVKRIFNRYSPHSFQWGPPKRVNDVAMLNLQQTDKVGDLVNGVIMDIDYQDLKSLLVREKGYDLVPISYISWEESRRNDIRPFSFKLAYTFVISETSPQARYYIKRGINPVPGYALASEEGARSFGCEFLWLWRRTTYLSDGRSTFTDWLNNPNLDCSQQVH